MKSVVLFFILLLACAPVALAQKYARGFAVGARPRITVENRFGQVRVVAAETAAQSDGDDQTKNPALLSNTQVTVEAVSPNGAIAENAIAITATNDAVDVSVNQTASRVDLLIRAPARSQLKITGATGAIEILGDFVSAEAATDTGTIYANVPTEQLKYDFVWTQRRPLFLSETALAEPKEKSGGKFSISGKLPDDKSKAKAQNSKPNDQPKIGDEADGEKGESNNKETKNKDKKSNDKRVSLNFTTNRGLILLNVSPSEVPSDLRDRPLTEAAKAVVRSNDSLLSEAIRKVSPKRFDEYARSLPPRRAAPNLALRTNKDSGALAPGLRRVNVSVTDDKARNIGSLQPADFAVFENGEPREITNVETTNAPFNLVLLLDVSGSVEERVDFIRKAARNFLNTVSPRDKLAVVTFRDDAKVLANFSQDKRFLSERLDTFDAGGGTALYDSLAFVLAEVLRPIRNERTAIVILSDGDDNRSFLPLEPLLGAVEESGTLVYPLYVPSTLNASGAANSNQTVDPLRARFLTVTSKAEADAKKLAESSGGVYFPIRRLEDLQKAYEDVAAQLRTAYSITYRSEAAQNGRLRVTVKKPNAFVRIGSQSEVRETSRLREIPATQNPAFQKIGFSRASAQNADITGEIKRIVYKPLLTVALKEFAFENFDVNRAPPSFVVGSGANKIAASRWVSPKRTRSYAYERVYNTLTHAKRAAVIPVVKDEGKNGERDFLAWDTISLLNLLEVHAVLSYYNAATKSSRRADSLIDQQFDNAFVLNKLKEIGETKLAAFEWNLRELKNLRQTLERAEIAYRKIGEQTGVKLHDASGLVNFEQKLNGDISQFLKFSRQKSERAQTREFVTEQPKETMPTRTKSRVTITDHLGGKYFLTVDEAIVENDALFLIESKHNQGGKLTSVSDLKDGLVKMILYRNLTAVKRAGKTIEFKPVLRLTASKMQSAAASSDDDSKLKDFCRLNNYSANETELLQKLFAEARQNNFLVRLEPADATKR